MSRRWLTRTDAKAALGEMPARTFALWVKRGLPRKGDGKKEQYPWPDVYHWILDQIERRARENARPKDIEEAHKRKAAADAELAELELAERRNLLMTVEAYESIVGAAFARVAARLKAAPTKYAPRIVGLKTIPDAVTILQAAFHECMDELYQGKDVPVPDDEDQAVGHADDDADDEDSD